MIKHLLGIVLTLLCALAIDAAAYGSIRVLNPEFRAYLIPSRR